MRRKIPSRIRQEVARRAGYRCEYCLIHEEDTFYGCQVEHIISLKHGGTDDLDNLAYACAFCNYSKGANIATVLGETDRMVRLYNPRRDCWQEHFRLEGAYIVPISEIGEATVKVLALNHPARVMEREMLIRAGKYPPTDER
jgi:hypothetical protein